jgi:hypothetical protein
VAPVGLRNGGARTNQPGRPAVQRPTAESHPAPCDRATLAAALLQGGYPEAVARTSAKRRGAWFESYLDTILQRDVVLYAGREVVPFGDKLWAVPLSVAGVKGLPGVCTVRHAASAANRQLLAACP